MTTEKLDAITDHLVNPDKPEIPESELPFDKDGNPNHHSVKKGIKNEIHK